jgi:hypothetical protein
MLQLNFTVMVIVYLIFAAFMIGFGQYYKLICKTYIRWILDNVISVMFESAIVISIMYLHHKCA